MPATKKLGSATRNPESVLDKERLTMTQAAQRAKVNPGTTWRWALKGIRGRKLPTVMLGGRRFVLTEDLEQFMNDGRDGDSTAGAERESFEQSAADADAKLAAILKPSQCGGDCGSRDSVGGRNTAEGDA